VNTAPAGQGSAPAPAKIELDSNSKTPAQDKVLELAEKIAKEKGLSISQAIKTVLSETAELRKKYEDEASVRQ